MVREHHWLNGHEFEQIPGDSEGQGSLVCCSPWGCKESDSSSVALKGRQLGGQAAHRCSASTLSAVIHWTKPCTGAQALCDPWRTEATAFSLALSTHLQQLTFTKVYTQISKWKWLSSSPPSPPTGAPQVAQWICQCRRGKRCGSDPWSGRSPE